jgi:hypothetical protein
LPHGPPFEEITMGVCAVCHNDYQRSFDVVMDGVSHTFDSFECAIHRLAPTCDHCGCRIIGHGTQAGTHYYCCANCARHEGQTGIVDHV